MKKIIGYACAVLLGFSGLFGVKDASAHDSVSSTITPPTAQTQRGQADRWEMVKEFSSEMHQLNQLQVKALGYKQQLVQKHDALMDPVLKAKEAKNTALFNKAKPIRQQMKANHDQMRQLHEKMHEAMKGFQEEVKKKNIDAARSHLNDAIKVKGQMNALLEKQVGLLDQLTSVFS